MPGYSQVLDGLKNSPIILKDFLESLPKEILKERRRLNKWSIHEHACHLAKVEEMIAGRLQTFIQEEKPVFIPYVPGKNVRTDDLIEMNLQQALEEYTQHRNENIDKLASFDESAWHKEAEHPEYKLYIPFIMARHVLFHDHFHLYRMEELWLTKSL